MKKLFTIAIVLLGSLYQAIGQQLMKSYYDWQKTSKKEEYYVNAKGERHGSYKAYDQAGILSLQYNYKNGLLDGECIEYSTTTGRQVLAQKETYKDGLKNGPAVYYNGAGLPYRQGSYKDDKKEGAWVYIDGYTNYDLSDADKKGCEYTKGTLMFKAGEQVDEGKVITIFYPSGKTCIEANYVNGKKVGDNIAYYPNGSKQSYDKYDANGKLMLRQVWYPNGKIQLSDSWETGELVHEGYNQDGSPDMQMNYQKEQKIKNEAQAKQDAIDYAKYIADADKAFSENDFEHAKEFYASASRSMPKEKHPSERLKVINEKYKEKNKNQDEIVQLLTFLKKEQLPTQNDFVFNAQKEYTSLYTGDYFKMMFADDPGNYGHTLMDLAVSNNNRGIFSAAIDKCNKIYEAFPRSPGGKKDFIYTDSLLHALRNLVSAGKDYLSQSQKLKTNIEQLNQLKESDKDNKKLYSKMLDLNEKEQAKISNMVDGSLIVPLLASQNLVFEKAISMKGKDNTELMKQIKSADTIEAAKKILGL